MTRIATKPTTYGSGEEPCSRPSSSIVLPIAAIQGTAMTLYQIAPSTKNTIEAIQTATCLALLTAILLRLREQIRLSAIVASQRLRRMEARRVEPGLLAAA